MKELVLMDTKNSKDLPTNDFTKLIDSFRPDGHEDGVTYMHLIGKQMDRYGDGRCYYSVGYSTGYTVGEIHVDDNDVITEIIFNGHLSDWGVFDEILKEKTKHFIGMKAIWNREEK